MVESMDRPSAPATTTAKRKKKKTRRTLLSSTRPIHLHTTKSTPLPSSAGRALIRTHHTLHKRLTAAIACYDERTANTIRAEIESLGGLKRYQEASLAGQSKERGGDTSGILVQWLSSYKGKQQDLRLLEVGALSIDNACARSKIFEGGVERIDLHSRHPQIKQQDIMKRPLPVGKEEMFDVVSLSLVVNFVGDPKGRGEMLQRVRMFLRTRHGVNGKGRGGTDQDGDAVVEGRGDGGSEDEDALLPALFLVLPAPCVNNSRYLDEERLRAMMQALGYRVVKRKMSSKLVYYLWRYYGTEGSDEPSRARNVLGKEEIRKGQDRNNFAIVLK